MDPYIGIIMMFSGSFAPRDWAYCDGSLQSIAQNTALFSILGTMYGGDGQVTFALPDLRGRVAVGMGTGPGLSSYTEGQMSGTETVTMTTNQMPMHNHVVNAAFQVAVSANPASTEEAAGGFLTNTANAFYAAAGTPGNTLGGVSSTVQVGIAGGGQPIPIVQPYIAMNYIISLYGIFPSRN